MIIICEECGKKYRVDPEKIKSPKSNFKCKVCDHVITVHKPDRDTKTLDKKIQPSSLNTRESDSPDQPGKTGKITKKKPKPEFKKPKRFRFGLTAKLFIMMIIVSIVPLVTFGGITLKQMKERMIHDAKKNINLISVNIAGHVDEWLSKNVKILKTLSGMENIISMDPIRQETILKAVVDVYPWINLTFTVDTKGINIARSNGKSLQSFSNEKFFNDILNGKTIAWQIWTEKSSKIPYLILSVPIKRTNRFVGVLANAMRLDNVSKRIINWEGEKGGFAFLVDKNGKAIAHKNPVYVLQHKNLSRHPLIAAFMKGQRGSISFKDNHGNPILGNVRETALGWAVAIQLEEKEAFYFIEQLMSYAYLLLGVTIVFVFIIAWFFGRAISRPIIKLTDAADRISVGDLDVEIKTNQKDEIGDLAEAIARMQDSIRLSIERLRRKR